MFARVLLAIVDPRISLKSRDPKGRPVGDPQVLVGDTQIFIGDP